MIPRWGLPMGFGDNPLNLVFGRPYGSGEIVLTLAFVKYRVVLECGSVYGVRIVSGELSALAGGDDSARTGRVVSF